MQTRTRPWQVTRSWTLSAETDIDLVGTPLECADDRLVALQRRLGLDDAGLAELFDVGPRAIERWRRRGVPARQRSRLERLSRER
jgi:hypothetical protein